MLLIDGYNLLHATNIFGQGAAAGTLRGSREALVAFLVRRLPSKLLKTTTIVFDAASAPPGLPDQYEVEGLSIRFARGFGDADALLELLIEECQAPKGLLVVSGDHRVQRAARSRGAKYLDSETWFNGVRRVAPDSAVESPGEVLDSPAAWIENFSDPELLAEYERAHEALSKSAPNTEPTGSGSKRPKRKAKGPMSQRDEDRKLPFAAGLEEIFPPGYAEDLLSSDDSQSSG